MFFTLIGIGVICYTLFYCIITCFIDGDLTLAFYEKFGKPIRILQQKVVFITGASSGIGEHTAITLAKYGVKLVLSARRQNELERVKQACLVHSNGKLTANDVLVLPMDLLDIHSHERNFNYAIQYFGRVDILFNNAGRSQRAEWENIDLSVDKDLFELDVFSVINLSRIAVKYFNTQAEGHVAVTSSLAGIIPAPNSGSYTGAKHALHGYFNSLRLEKRCMNKKLTVSVLCPGPVLTNFLQEAYTANPGEKYGVTATSTPSCMSGERCGELCAISLANKLPETWMAKFPVLPLVYVFVYFPVLRNIFLKVIGPRKLFNFRISNTTAPIQVQTV